MASKPFIILSLSGGGFCGLYTARILSLLEADRGGIPLIKTIDMVAGTSIGGIIAIGLSLGQSARDICELFEESGPKVFGDNGNLVSRKLKNTFNSTRGLIISKYNSKKLSELISTITEQKKMQ